MAGHSKWKKIQHKKGATDAKRSNVFAKLAKEIFVAAKLGDPNPENNASLRLSIDKAKSQSMPKDNIERAIKRASGTKDNTNYEEIIYEGYGPEGVAIMLMCLTDNRNRTASFVKSTFSKNGGNLGADGSVSYLFNRKGLIVVDKNNIKIDVDTFELELIDLNVDDFTEDEDIIEIISTPDNYEKLKSYVSNNLHNEEFIKSEITMIPKNFIEATNVESVEKIIEILEDNDDIQDVYHNLKEL